MAPSEAQALKDQLAAIIDAKVEKPAPPKTEGELVAEKMVDEEIFTLSGGATSVFGMHVKSIYEWDTLTRQLRDAAQRRFAAAIDDERRKARREALEEAAKYCREFGANWTAGNIEQMAKS